MFLLGALAPQSRPNFDLTIMTKPRALVLFGSLTLMITGYAAWCSRTFWVRVGPPDLSPIPESQRAAALAAVEESGLTKPDPFSWEVMQELLMKPYDTAPRPLGVSIFREPQPPPRCCLHVYRARRSVRSNERPLVFFVPAPDHLEDWRLLTTPWGEVIYPGKRLSRK